MRHARFSGNDAVPITLSHTANEGRRNSPPAARTCASPEPFTPTNTHASPVNVTQRRRARSSVFIPNLEQIAGRKPLLGVALACAGPRWIYSLDGIFL